MVFFFWHIFFKISEAELVAQHKECDNCDEDLDEEDWFYSSLRDRNYDLCIQCYNKQIRKGKISQGQFKIAVYALPPGNVINTVWKFAIPVNLNCI